MSELLITASRTEDGRVFGVTSSAVLELVNGKWVSLEGEKSGLLCDILDGTKVPLDDDQW